MILDHPDQEAVAGYRVMLMAELGITLHTYMVHDPIRVLGLLRCLQPHNWREKDTLVR